MTLIWHSWYKFTLGEDKADFKQSWEYMGCWWHDESNKSKLVGEKTLLLIINFWKYLVPIKCYFDISVQHYVLDIFLNLIIITNLLISSGKTIIKKMFKDQNLYLTYQRFHHMLLFSAHAIGTIRCWINCWEQSIHLPMETIKKKYCQLAFIDFYKKAGEEWSLWEWQLCCEGIDSCNRIYMYTIKSLIQDAPNSNT